MFFKIRVLDQKGGLKKVITSEVLSQGHWKLFSDSLRNSTKKNILELVLKQEKIVP